MTEKQTTTLVLFAQNYSLQTIAKKQKVSLATIRERIKSLSKNHLKEFDNAAAIRGIYKKTRDAIKTKNIKSFDMFNVAMDFNEDTDTIKRVF